MTEKLFTGTLNHNQNKTKQKTVKFSSVSSELRFIAPNWFEMSFLKACIVLSWFRSFLILRSPSMLNFKLSLLTTSL